MEQSNTPLLKLQVFVKRTESNWITITANKLVQSVACGSIQLWTSRDAQGEQGHIVWEAGIVLSHYFVSHPEDLRRVVGSKNGAKPSRSHVQDALMM
ncbi:TPA: hypothetical protein ACH3X1_012958 [Trebouxia sp. C0004]